LDNGGMHKTKEVKINICILLAINTFWML
jgi:hypothetical protein